MMAIYKTATGVLPLAPFSWAIVATTAAAKLPLPASTKAFLYRSLFKPSKKTKI